MAIIVNADDFGMSREVNEAIADAFERGLIDRTTLLVNMPMAEDAMQMAAEKGFGDRVGIHLNLTAGRPLTHEMSTDPVMCNAAGEYTADFARNMHTRFYLPRETRRNVDRELRAQLDMFGKLGGNLWHVDSHHHVHTDPSVWLILKKILPSYPVVSVRLGRNMYRGKNPLMHLYKFMLNMSIKRFCKQKPSYFGSARDYADYVEKSADLFGRFNVEVMVHPVYDGRGNLCDGTLGELHELVRLH